MAKTIITIQPQAQTLVIGANFALSVGVQNPSGVSYQWFFRPIGGAFSAMKNQIYANFLPGPAQASQTGDYYCMAGGTKSNTVRINVVAAQQVLTRTSGGSINGWTLSASGNLSLNGKLVPGGDGTSAFTLSNGTYYGQDAASGQWYAYSSGNWVAVAINPLPGPPQPPPVTPPTPPVATSPVLSLQPESQKVAPGADFTLKVAVSAVTGHQYGYQWYRKASAMPNQNYDGLALPSDWADSYSCLVTDKTTGLSTMSDVAVITLSQTPPVLTAPVITSQPQAVSLALGAALSLSVVATGTGPLTYQWRNNGQPIGPNSANYSKSSIVLSDIGSYDCVISGPGGNVTSLEAVVSISQVIPPPSGAIVMPKVTANYPVALPLVKPGSVSSGTARLGIGSYTGVITLKSGQQLYGMPGTDCTGLVINADSVSGTVLSNLFGAVVNYTGICQGNIIRRCKWMTINIAGTFDSNIIYGSASALNVNGIWTNNRIIGQTRHGTADPTLYDQTIKGPAGSRASINNVILWGTKQSIPKPMLMSGQGDFAHVGMDIERNSTSDNASMDVNDTGTIRTFGLNGVGTTGFNVGCDELQVIGGQVSFNPGVQVNNLKRLLMVGIALSVSGTPGAIYSASSSGLAPLLAPTRVGSPWERPNMPAPPDPLNGNFKPPASYVDSTAAIQAAINKDGITLWPAGTYYMDGTAVTAPGQGLIGAGDGKTIFVSTKGLPCHRHQGNGGVASGTTPSAAPHYSDFTCYGGGLIFDHNGDQLTEMTLSFVTIRNAPAGMQAKLIYALDNNFFDHVNFVNCGAGVLQSPDPNYSGGETNTMTYFDKTVWYAGQFIGCGNAADMQAKRQNNLDAFLSCIFSGNVALGTFAANAALLFGNCDILSSGRLSVSGFPVGLTGCYLNGPGPYLSGDVVGEGLIFGGSGAAFVNPGTVVLLNSRPGGMTLAGTLLNCNDNAVGQLLFGSVMA